MLHEITGFDLLLDTTNPETPKFISPVTGDGQRASYTDVLLVLLIERMDALLEAQPKPVELIQGEIRDFIYNPEEAPQVEKTVKQEVSHPADYKTDDDGKPDPDGDNKPEPTSRRSNRGKKPSPETA